MAAGIYKTIEQQDRTTVKTRLNEAIPITGSVLSGSAYSDLNIKSYGHGMFQSVYDYPYLSSSANHLFDITIGVSTDWTYYSTITSQKQKKTNIYNQMAQVLVGYDLTGSILRFDRDGVYSDSNTETNKHLNPIFLNFSRLLTKDEIQKESFSMEFMVSSGYANPAVSSVRIKVFDSGALNEYKTNSPGGDYGILYATNSAGSPINGTSIQAGGADPLKVGLIYYQAGVVVLNPIMFFASSSGGLMSSSQTVNFDSLSNNFAQLFTGSAIDTIANSIRNRIYNISFNNTTELNSTIYFCRVDHNEFNYSSNPTYLSGSKMRVKNQTTDQPISYITTVGLYSANNELLAVGKLSEPLRKDPTQNYTLRVRLDY